jgi:hypothetical protein
MIAFAIRRSTLVTNPVSIQPKALAGRARQDAGCQPFPSRLISPSAASFGSTRYR